MKNIIGAMALMVLFVQCIHAQDVSGIHEIQKGSEPNEYSIKTSIRGLKGVDIARIKYFIDNNHTYKASPNNTLFWDRTESHIKFYIMAVPESGELDIVLGIIVADDSLHNFQVEIQFSRNEEKRSVLFPKINISVAEEIVIAEEIPEPVEPSINVDRDPIEIEDVEEESEIINSLEPDVKEIPEHEEVVEIAETLEEVLEEVVVKDIPETENRPEIHEEISEMEESVVEENLIPITDEEDQAVLEDSPVIGEVLNIEDSSPPILINRINTMYTVQLLSLAEFSQERLNTFCKEHNLPANSIKKNQVDTWVKITYGEANSVQEAMEIKNKLMRDNNIKDAFVTQLK